MAHHSGQVAAPGPLRLAARAALDRALPHLSPRLRDWVRAIRQVRGDYARAHGRPPALLRPRRFTEKMQWRKLFDLDPRLAIFSDKLATRDWVAARVGPACLPELLWSGEDPAAIPLERLDPPYVLKATHGFNQTAIVERPPGDGADADAAGLRARAAGWLSDCHGTRMVEPGYVPVPRRLMVERRIAGTDGGRPAEYRLMCFDGRVRMIQATLPRADAQGRWAVSFWDGAWRPIEMRLTTAPTVQAPPPEPRRSEMIALAERLSAGTTHLRVDLYDSAHGVLVGELTCYSWSGLSRITPPAMDDWLGAHWRIPAPGLTAAAAVLFRRRAVQRPAGPAVARGASRALR
jgi:hypothetical protein